MKKQKMSTEDHEAIAAWLNDPILAKMSCKIPNAYGKSSKIGKGFRRLYSKIQDVKSSLEGLAFSDQIDKNPMDIYYPQSEKPEHK